MFNPGKTKQFQLFALTCLSIGFSAGCARKPDAAEKLEIAVTTFEVQSAVGSLNAALNDSEIVPEYAHLRPITPERAPAIHEKILNEIIPCAYADSCSINRFDPPIGSSSCAGTENNKTVISSFDSCTVGKYDQFTLDGEVKLSFDQPSTCDSWIDGGALPDSGNLTRTSSNFIRYNPNGSYVTVNSDSHQNYKGDEISGGARTNFKFGSREVEILGLHRKRTSFLNTNVFDHSVTTKSGEPVVVTGTKINGNRTVASGVILVDHNKAKFTTSADFTGLSWVSSCCHPVIGSIHFQRSGSKDGSLLVDFDTGTCGQANVLFESGILEGKEVKIDLYSCE